TGITTLTNDSAVNIFSGRTLGVNAAINAHGATISDSGKFNVTTTLTNAGSIGIALNASLTAGSITNESNGVSEPGGVVTNNGTVTVKHKITNDGQIVNNDSLTTTKLTNNFDGTVVNKGKLTVDDELTNSGLITNKGRGTLTADAVTNNLAGQIVN